MKSLYRAITSVLLLAVLTGVCFPVLVWLLAQTVFPFQANGSLLSAKAGGQIGSELIGQNFTKPGYFHPRASSAGSGYDASNSSGSNLGPTSKKLNSGLDDDTTTEADESFSGMKTLAARYRLENDLPEQARIPADAASRSGSGLDPHISPENAELQVRRVAKARGLDDSSVRALVQLATEGRFLGIFGEPRVNVLKLNLSLDRTL